MKHTTVAPLPARYIWDGAVGSTVDCRTIDPSGRHTASMSRKRPAVALSVAHAGTICYKDSAGDVCVASAIVGILLPGDFQQILASGTVVPGDGGSNVSVTPTAHSITLYWDI